MNCRIIRYIFVSFFFFNSLLSALHLHAGMKHSAFWWLTPERKYLLSKWEYAHDKSQVQSNSNLYSMLFISFIDVTRDDVTPDFFFVCVCVAVSQVGPASGFTGAAYKQHTRGASLGSGPVASSGWGFAWKWDIVKGRAQGNDKMYRSTVVYERNCF